MVSFSHKLAAVKTASVKAAVSWCFESTPVDLLLMVGYCSTEKVSNERTAEVSKFPAVL